MADHLLSESWYNDAFKGLSFLIIVVLLDLMFDGGMQIEDEMDDAALQAFPGQDGERGLDGTQQGTQYRCEVETPGNASLH